MRRPTYFLAALLLTAVLPAQAKSLHWSSVDVDAKLDRDGALEVSETQAFVLDGDWNGGERRFNIRSGQTLELLGVERLDGANVIPLRAGNLAEVDRYQLMDGNVLRWRSRLPADPEFAATPITYRIRYALRGVLRGRDGEYQLAHDFLFPDRAGVVKRFSLRLTTDPVWSGIEPVLTRTATSLPPGAGYAVSRVLKWNGTGEPAAAITLASPFFGRVVIALIVTGMAALAFRFFIHEKRRGRFGAFTPASQIDDAWLEEHIFTLSPEAVGAAWDGRVGAAEVAAAIASLVQEKKIETTVEKRMLRRARLTMRLLVDRDTIDGHRGAIVRKLFWGNRNETDTDAIRKHYSSTGLDLAAFVSPAVEKELGRVPRWKTKTKVVNWKTTLILLVLSVVAMIGTAVTNNNNLALMLVALFFGFFALIGSAIAARANADAITKIPLRLMLVFAFSVPLFASVIGYLLSSGELAFGIPAMLAAGAFVLAVVNLTFDAMRTSDSEEKLEFRRKLLSARRYLREQLLSPQPQLRDDWFPYLLAFGLGENVESWFRAYGVAEGVATTGIDRSTSTSFGSSSSISRPSWTGGGGGFGGAGATGTWAVAAAAVGAGVSAPSSSGSGGSSGSGSSSSSSSSSGSSSGGGGGGGW